MTRAAIESFLAEGRLGLPHPLEAPAITSGPPWGDDRNAECSDCGAPLTLRECEPQCTEGIFEGLCRDCEQTDNGECNASVS